MIPGVDVNVASDVAFCRACNLAHRLSTLVHWIPLEADPDLYHPPDGAWYRSTGMGAIIGATHRSLGMAIGLLATSLFWNGIVSVFVLLAVSATLNLLQVPLPDWFPAPRMNGEPMGPGMTIFLWLFLTPFILIGLGMFAGFLSALGGRTEVRIHHREGVIFTGIGGLGFRRRFNAGTIKDVRIACDQWRDSDDDRRSRTRIVIEAHDGKLLEFGASLREDRMKFLAAALRKLVLS